VSAPEGLERLERPAVDEPAGLLLLHHGRGTDERDLLGLADVLDPGRRLHVVTPRAPFTLPGAPGYHWYVVPRVGYPDHDTFHSSFERLTAFHDECWARTGIAPDRTILGGFSMGAVMSYATGLAADRPRPAGILALSGFVPTVEDWQPDLAGRAGLPVFIGHGRGDPVIGIAFARAARELLEQGGLAVEYHEFEGAHHVDPAEIEAAAGWAAALIE
jgi:phospholipase/carboxylesterase